MVVLDIILLLFSWLDSDLALVNIVVVVWLLAETQETHKALWPWVLVEKKSSRDPNRSESHSFILTLVQSKSFFYYAIFKLF